MEDHKVKKWFMVNLPWIFLLVGSLALVVGYTIEPPDISYAMQSPGSPQVPSDKIYRAISKMLQSIGAAVLGAGIFAAVLKSFQFIGLFQEELGKVIYSDEYLKRQNPAYLAAQWERLMDALHTKNFPDIKKKIANAILETILHADQKYYFESFKFYFHDVTLINENGKDYVTYNLITTAKIVPIQKTGTFPFVNTFKAISDVNSRRDITSLKIDGKEVDLPTVTSGMPPEVYSIDLSGDVRHDFIKKESRKFPFDEPTNEQQLFELSRMCNGLHVDFQYDSAKLNISFIGKTINDFTTLRQDKGYLIKDYDGVLFKNHGYCVVLYRV